VNHWLILPILIPAIVAPLLALAVRHDIVLARIFSVGSTVLLLVLGMFQLSVATDDITHTYALGNWPAPFGIVLVLDRLSAIMLFLTAVLSLMVLLYSINGCDQKGQHFHPLFQFQLMGLNGAFLTGDLFNLFVFFEILLIASYGLMVHGGGPARMRAGLQYVAVNLVGSSVFLFALGMIYGVTGTLNMADLAVKVPQVASGDAALLSVGAALLLIVFGIKAAMFPLQFWLPGTYSNAAGPIAALFSIMTKVGAYSIIRVFTLAFGESANQHAWFGADWLMAAAIVTTVMGFVGVVAARSLGQQASFAALGSMGTLMIAVAGFTQDCEAAAIYYLVQSTLASAALFLIVDAILIRRPGYGDALVLSPKFKHNGIIGSMFFLCVIGVSGLPPLSGFIGKLFVLDAVAQLAGWPWIWAVILVTSLLGIIGFASSGSLLFWKSGEVPGHLDSEPSRPIVLPMVAVGGLLALLILLTGFSGQASNYFDATAEQIFDTNQYVETVLRDRDAAMRGVATEVENYD
jgi:multicomponent K+:H+ antiporter subunit D